MTEAGWWERIVAFTRSREWNGLLVAADGLQELGRDDLADGLRWAVRAGVVPTEKDWIWTVSLSFSSHHVMQCYSDSHNDIIRLWRWVINTRAAALVYFGGNQ